MENNQTEYVISDDGFFFGLGVFETIAVENGKPVLLQKHLSRMHQGLKQLGIENVSVRDLDEMFLQNYINEKNIQRGAIKIIVTEKNLLLTNRVNPYTHRDYERGFSVILSNLTRNETSPFTFLKSLNYGECILEKRRARSRGADEPVFLNTRGFLTEGATTNLFLVKQGEIITPGLKNGLLNGTVREWVMEHYPVAERDVTWEEALLSDEIFLTNALLGVMPVSHCGVREFSVHDTARQILLDYRRDCF
ncbi:MAG: aminotransferase class IV [Eubacterium sp.]